LIIVFIANGDGGVVIRVGASSGRRCTSIAVEFGGRDVYEDVIAFIDHDLVPIGTPHVALRAERLLSADRR
jgi:hypothetical protein